MRRLRKVEKVEKVERGEVATLIVGIEKVELVAKTLANVDHYTVYGEKLNHASK